MQLSHIRIIFVIIKLAKEKKYLKIESTIAFQKSVDGAPDLMMILVMFNHILKQREIRIYQLFNRLNLWNIHKHGINSEDQIETGISILSDPTVPH